MTGSAYLFDDNPATNDLTGLRSVAVAIADVVVDARFETLTVGLNSPWGGGKSTALNLIKAELRGRECVVVVDVDPWEFVDSGDPRGTLVNRVLEGIAAELDAERLAARIGSTERLAGIASSLVENLNQLRKRVSWSKVAQVAITSAVTLTPNIAGLVEALTPAPEMEPAAKGMRDFRADFGALLNEMGEEWRVVVLIDDLDRALPDDVLGALEAIKLFLSVQRMSFVIAADDDFIRESLRDALDRSGGNRGRFADRYTEKIVQLPFTVPRLSPADAVAYLSALLVQAEGGVALAGQRGAASRSTAIRVDPRAGDSPLLHRILLGQDATQRAERFLVVARHGTMTAAAHELGVTLSVLGTQMKRLAIDAGAPLVTRAQRGEPLTLTCLGLQVWSELAAAFNISEAEDRESLKEGSR